MKNSDWVTKTLLALIALALWLNLIASFTRPVQAQTADFQTTVVTALLDIETRVRRIETNVDTMLTRTSGTPAQIGRVR